MLNRVAADDAMVHDGMMVLWGEALLKLLVTHLSKAVRGCLFG
jgi:hypothetical protein